MNASSTLQMINACFISTSKVQKLEIKILFWQNVVVLSLRTLDIRRKLILIFVEFMVCLDPIQLISAVLVD